MAELLPMKFHTTFRRRGSDVLGITETSLCRLDCPDFVTAQSDGTELVRVSGGQVNVVEHEGRVRIVDDEPKAPVQ